MSYPMRVSDRHGDNVLKSPNTYRSHNIFDPMYENHGKEVNMKRSQSASAERKPSLSVLSPNIYKSKHQYKKDSKGRHRIDSMVQKSEPPTDKNEYPYQKSSKLSLIDLMLKNKKKFDIFQRRNNGPGKSFQEYLKSPEAQQKLLEKVMKEPGKLVPGAYPPFMEATIIRKMKEIATCKTKQGLYEESHAILINILNCEISSLGRAHPQVANTLYKIGVALSYLGDSEAALLALQEGINILYPRRLSDDNIDLAALFYQYGAVKGINRDYLSAIYHLELAGQVEMRILGYCTEKTIKKTSDYKYAHRASRQLNKIPRTA